MDNRMSFDSLHLSKRESSGLPTSEARRRECRSGEWNKSRKGTPTENKRVKRGNPTMRSQKKEVEIELKKLGGKAIIEYEGRKPKTMQFFVEGKCWMNIEINGEPVGEPVWCMSGIIHDVKIDAPKNTYVVISRDGIEERIPLFGKA